jgi:hypothetical protein
VQQKNSGVMDGRESGLTFLSYFSTDALAGRLPYRLVARRFVRGRYAGRVCDSGFPRYAGLAGLPPQVGVSPQVGVYSYMLGGLGYALRVVAATGDPTHLGNLSDDLSERLSI